MKISKDSVYGRTYQIFLIIISLGIMIFLFNLKFLIISLIFFGVLGGGYEFITLNKFYSKEKKIKKDNLKESIKYGFLWVHFNIDCIKKYGTKLYDFKKIGSLPTFVAYLIMTIYVLLALILYKNFSYYGLLVYLIPGITNIFSFWKNNYYIISK